MCLVWLVQLGVHQNGGFVIDKVIHGCLGKLVTNPARDGVRFRILERFLERRVFITRPLFVHALLLLLVFEIVLVATGTFGEIDAHEKGPPVGAAVPVRPHVLRGDAHIIKNMRVLVHAEILRLLRPSAIVLAEPIVEHIEGHHGILGQVHHFGSFDELSDGIGTRGNSLLNLFEVAGYVLPDARGLKFDTGGRIGLLAFEDQIGQLGLQFFVQIGVTLVYLVLEFRHQEAAHDTPRGIHPGTELIAQQKPGDFPLNRARRLVFPRKRQFFARDERLEVRPWE